LQAGGGLGFGLGERFLHLRSICTRGGFGTGKARRRRRRRWWASEQRRVHPEAVNRPHLSV
jgi:hypothetical protein